MWHYEIGKNIIAFESWNLLFELFKIKVWEFESMIFEFWLLKIKKGGFEFSKLRILKSRFLIKYYYHSNFSF